jgi:hypothetical protein
VQGRQKGTRSLGPLLSRSRNRCRIAHDGDRRYWNRGANRDDSPPETLFTQWLPTPVVVTPKLRSRKFAEIGTGSRPAWRIHLTLSLALGQSYRSPRSADDVCIQGNAPSFERSHDRVRTGSAQVLRQLHDTSERRCAANRGERRRRDRISSIRL